MKCDQCEMLQITTGGASLPCHEIGCPNSHKVWNEEDQEWVIPPVSDEEIEDWWNEVEDWNEEPEEEKDA